MTMHLATNEKPFFKELFTTEKPKKKTYSNIFYRNCYTANIEQIIVSSITYSAIDVTMFDIYLAIFKCGDFDCFHFMIILKF